MSYCTTLGLQEFCNFFGKSKKLNLSYPLCICRFENWVWLWWCWTQLYLFGSPYWCCLSSWFCHIMIAVAVQNQKDTENPLVHLCDCSGNSPGCFLLIKWGTVSSVGAQSRVMYLVRRQTLCEMNFCSWALCAAWLLRNTVLPVPPLPLQKGKKIGTGLRPNINDSLHFRLIKWVCVAS